MKRARPADAPPGIGPGALGAKDQPPEKFVQCMCHRLQRQRGVRLRMIAQRSKTSCLWQACLSQACEILLSCIASQGHGRTTATLAPRRAVRATFLAACSGYAVACRRGGCRRKGSEGRNSGIFFLLELEKRWSLQKTLERASQFGAWPRPSTVRRPTAPSSTHTCRIGSTWKSQGVHQGQRE